MCKYLKYRPHLQGKGCSMHSTHTKTFESAYCMCPIAMKKMGNNMRKLNKYIKLQINDLSSACGSIIDNTYIGTKLFLHICLFMTRHFTPLSINSRTIVMITSIPSVCKDLWTLHQRWKSGRPLWLTARLCFKCPDLHPGK